MAEEDSLERLKKIVQQQLSKIAGIGTDTVASISERGSIRDMSEDKTKIKEKSKDDANDKNSEMIN